MTQDSASTVSTVRRAAVADRLHAAAILLLRQLRREDRRTGLSGPRASALSVLVFGGPMGVATLARAEQVSTPTMSRIVAGLERSGLVEREPDPSDGRAVRLRATARGRRVLARGRARRLRVLEQRLDRLSDDELDTLESAVASLERMLQTKLITDH